jgi:hypothetical protein
MQEPSEQEIMQVQLDLPVIVNEAVKAIANAQHRSARKQYAHMIENMPEVRAMVAQMQGEQA